MPSDKRIWTTQMLSFIRKNFDKKSNPEIANHLGVPLQSLRTQLYSMGLYRMQLEYWTDEQIVFLKRHYKTVGDKELAILFNEKWEKAKSWTWKHMEKKRLYLNLKRTKAQLLKIKKRNVLRGCWQDTTTWQTRGEFENGTIRIWRSSVEQGGSYFKVIKVDGIYVHYARWLYQQHHGKMKRGHVIGFKDGDNMNVTIDNLESITRGEHAIRNRTGHYKYPEDLKEVMQLLKQLNYLIKQKT